MAGGAAIAKESKTEKILDQVSREAYTAMQDVRFARVAIFEDQLKAAEKYLDEAKKKLAAAEKEAPELTVTVKSEQKVGDETITKHETAQTTDYVPIDAWLVLSEDFVPTPEKKAEIKKANEHLKKGETAKAIEVLRAVDVGISVTRVLMPLKLTITHVDGALAMLLEHKYYEANLALKGVQDGLIMDTVLLYAPVTPAKESKSGKKS
jgi:glucan-binding YG repeat protein